MNCLSMPLHTITILKYKKQQLLVGKLMHGKCHLLNNSNQHLERQKQCGLFVL